MINKMNGVKLELNEPYQKILYWFFSFPNQEIGLNELSSELKISKTTAKMIVNKLIHEKFLIKKVYGKKWMISCNKQHYFFFSHKIAFNLLLVSELYHKELREIIIKHAGNYKSVILFGSYRKGDDNEKSDIDLAVEVSGSSEIKIIELGIVSKLGFREKVPVNLHIFSGKKINTNLFANIANGIVLEGFLEV